MKQRHEAEKRRVRIARVEEHIPTQEELLEEAEETAKENLKSLEKYRRMELEKKKTRPTKRICTGPIIRYHSMTMPLIEEAKDKSSIKSEVDDNEEDRMDADDDKP